MKKVILSLALTFVFAFSGIALVGCGSTSIYGTYTFDSLTVVVNGTKLTDEELEEADMGATELEGSSVTLNKDKTGTLTNMAEEGSEINFTFTVDGKIVTLVGATDEDVKRLPSESDGMTIVFSVSDGVFKMVMTQIDGTDTTVVTYTYKK